MFAMLPLLYLQVIRILFLLIPPLLPLIMTFVLWRRILIVLGSTLSQCATNHKRLESIFRKKDALHLNAHPSRYTHAYHAHTHEFMYIRVYTCTHCDRKGHLAKFYYDRLNALNFASQNVWVRRATNPHVKSPRGGVNRW